MSEFVCAVCMAVAKAGIVGRARDSVVVTLYEGTAYCLEHLCHVDEAVGEIRRHRENSNRVMP